MTIGAQGARRRTSAAAVNSSAVSLALETTTATGPLTVQPASATAVARIESRCIYLFRVSRGGAVAERLWKFYIE